MRISARRPPGTPVLARCRARPVCRAAPPAAPGSRWPPGPRSSGWARTLADRYGFRARSTASWASRTRPRRGPPPPPFPPPAAIPLSHSLDPACALTRSVRDAIVAHEVLAARHVARSQAPLSEYRLALVSTWFLDDMDATVARAFERSIATLRQAGARIAHIAPPAMQAAPAYGFP